MEFFSLVGFLVVVVVVLLIACGPAGTGPWRIAQFVCRAIIVGTMALMMVGFAFAPWPVLLLIGIGIVAVGWQVYRDVI